MEEPAPFRFLSLPAELRFRVYSLVFVKDHVLVFNRELYSPTRFEDSMLLANKSIFTEALPFLFSSNVFRWNYPVPKPRFNKLSALPLSQIRRLECAIWDEGSGFYMPELDQMCLLIRKHCPRLEELELDYDFLPQEYFFKSTALARLFHAGTSFQNPRFTTIAAHVQLLQEDGLPSYAFIASDQFERVENEENMSPLRFPLTLTNIKVRCYLDKDELELVERVMRRKGWETRQRVERVDQHLIGLDDTVVDITWKKPGTN